MFLLDCLKKIELFSDRIKTSKNSLFGVKPIGYAFAHNAQVFLLVFIIKHSSKQSKSLYFFPFITNTSVPPRTMSEWLM